MSPSQLYVRPIAVVVAALLVAAGVPGVAMGGGSLDADRPAQQAQVQSFEQPAREGAERAIAALESRGTDIPAALREAAVVGAVEGARSVQATEPAPSAGVVRQAAYGAVFGALRRNNAHQLNTETIRSAVSGGVIGASIAPPIATAQGGNATGVHVLAGAQGAAEGAVSTASRAAGQQSSLGGEYVEMAAMGGSVGTVAAAGIFPVFGSSIDPAKVYAAAFGGAAGGLQGTAEELAETGRPTPVESLKTFATSASSSAGVLSATLANQQLTGQRLSNTAYAVARETMRRSEELTQGQMIEVAITEAATRLVDIESGDSVFGQALFLSNYGVAIGPPRDPDNDGRYEDVNGNLVLSYEDVVTLSILQYGTSWDYVDLSETQRSALDFNQDGVFDARDMWALDEEITAATNSTA